MKERFPILFHSLKAGKWEYFIEIEAKYAKSSLQWQDSNPNLYWLSHGSMMKDTMKLMILIPQYLVGLSRIILGVVTDWSLCVTFFTKLITSHWIWFWEDWHVTVSQAIVLYDLWNSEKYDFWIWWLENSSWYMAYNKCDRCPK